MVSSTSQVAAAPAQYDFASAADISGETFLTLLSAELQNQDPLEPMSSKDMLDQITQLNMISQLTQLNDVLADSNKQTVTDVASLIGKHVEWIDPTTGNLVSGNVTKVQRDDAGWQVVVGNQSAGINSLISVR